MPKLRPHPSASESGRKARVEGARQREQKQAHATVLRAGLERIEGMIREMQKLLTVLETERREHLRQLRLAERWKVRD